MINSLKQDVWVGITDLETEGVWKFVTDDTIFDPNKGNTLYPWSVGEPNNQNGNQHCGCSFYWYKDKLDDDNCWKNKFGLCEIEK